MRCLKCKTQNAASAKFCQECGQFLKNEQSEEITLSQKRPDWLEIDENVSTKIRKKLEKAQEGLGGTRRFVTILFADIQGFTSLCERLDPEEATELMNQYLGQLAKDIYEFEGYVDKFMGDAIMALFGAPIAHENDPELAIRAALKMLKSIGDLNRKRNLKLNIRIGVNAGMVIAGGVGTSLKLEFTVMGDAVNLAQRLQSLAKPGTIVVGRSVADRTHNIFDFKLLPLQKVKGKAKEVEAFEVGLVKQKATTVRDLQESQIPLIGRKEILKNLRPIINSIRNKHSHHFLIEGPAGIGKSRIKFELRKALRKQGIKWHEVTCSHLQKNSALAPMKSILQQVLSEYLYIDSDKQRPALKSLKPLGLPKGSQSLLESLLEISEGNGVSSPYESKISKFASLRQLFRALAKENAFILFFDDFHWADEMTVELLQYLAGSSSHFVMGVSRRKDDDRALKSFHQVELEPLSNSETKLFIQTMLQTKNAPEKLNDLILKNCQGNPLYVSESIKNLKEKEILKEKNGHWELSAEAKSIQLSDSLNGIVLSRLDDLPSEDREVLEWASILGRRFSVNHLKRLIRDELNLAESMQFLRRKGLLYEDRVDGDVVYYTFNSTVTRDVVQGSILKMKRKQMHEKVARLFDRLISKGAKNLEESYLFHCLESKFTSPATFDVLLDFLDSKIPTEGLVWIRKMKTLFSSENLANHLLLKEAKFLADQADWKSSRDLIREILPSLSGSIQADGYHLLGQTCLELGQFEQAISNFTNSQKVAQDLEDQDRQMRALKSLANCSAKQGRLKEAVETFQKAMQHHREVSGPTVVELLNDLGIVMMKLRDTEGAKKVFEQAKRMAAESSFGRLEAQVENNLGALALESSQNEEALKHFDNSIQISQKTGDMVNEMRCYYNSGLCLFKTSSWTQAEEKFNKSIKLAEWLGLTDQVETGKIQLEHIKAKQSGDFTEFNRLMASHGNRS